VEDRIFLTVEIKQIYLVPIWIKSTLADVVVKVRQDSKMRSVMDAFCEYRRVSSDAVTFKVWKGVSEQELTASCTPLDLGLRDGGGIKAVVLDASQSCQSCRKEACPDPKPLNSNCAQHIINNVGTGRDHRRLRRAGNFHRSAELLRKLPTKSLKWPVQEQVVSPADLHLRHAMLSELLMLPNDAHDEEAIPKSMDGSDDEPLGGLAEDTLGLSPTAMVSMMEVALAQLKSSKPTGVHLTVWETLQGICTKCITAPQLTKQCFSAAISSVSGLLNEWQVADGADWMKGDKSERKWALQFLRTISANRLCCSMLAEQHLIAVVSEAVHTTTGRYCEDAIAILIAWRAAARKKSSRACNARL